jgi:uncharacterized membrane protein YeaQ/YmgE (transglycosylase-associated protein family)
VTAFEPASLIVPIFIGLVAGWLAGRIVRVAGFGLVGDIFIGIVGAFFGTWLLGIFGIVIVGGVASAVTNAAIGAIILLLIARLIKHGQIRDRPTPP